VYYTELASDAEDWVDTSKTALQDDDDAYVSFSASTDDTSDWLQLTNFGFTIPSGATIDIADIILILLVRELTMIVIFSISIFTLLKSVSKEFLFTNLF